MGKSNPSARGYASAYNSMITTRYEGGGNKKAGLGMHIGMGPFINAAINHGAAGHQAPRVSGARQGMVYFQVTGKQYPISCVNQLSGVGMPRRGMWNASADGVNKAKCEAMQKRHHPDTLHACGICGGAGAGSYPVGTNCILNNNSTVPLCWCTHCPTCPAGWNSTGGSNWPIGVCNAA